MGLDYDEEGLAIFSKAGLQQLLKNSENPEEDWGAISWITVFRECVFTFSGNGAILRFSFNHDFTKVLDISRVGTIPGIQVFHRLAYDIHGVRFGASSHVYLHRTKYLLAEESTQESTRVFYINLADAGLPGGA